MSPSDILTRAARPPDQVLRYGPRHEQFADLRLPVWSDETESSPGSAAEWRPEWPVVIFLHGGFWRAAYDRTHAGPLAEALAAAGFAVCTPEYRRTGQPGGGWPGTFDDVAAAVDALPGLVAAAAGGRADLGRVVLAGHSAGGLVVLEAARKMLEAGEPEPRVMLLDTARPYGNLDYYWGESVMLWRQLPRIAAERLLAAASKPFRRPTQAPAPADPQPSAGGLADADDTSVNASTTQPGIAKKRYQVAPYGGKVAVMRTRQGWLIAMGRRTLGWSSVTRERPDLIPVPGAHMTMLRPPHVEVVARRMTDWLSAR